MATLIDSLVVGLGLDPKGFEKGSKDARAELNKTRNEARKTASEIEERGKQAAAFFTRLRNEALTFFAVLTVGTGLKDFAVNTITGASALGRLSANLGMSTRELSAWQKANERAGGTKDGIVAQLKESQQEAAKYRTGLTPANISAFAKYGGDFNAYRSGNALLLERSRIISELYAKSPDRAALAAQELGIQEDTYNLIKQGPRAIQALIEAQAKNSVVTEKDAEQADRLRIRMLDLRDSLQATATRILLTLAPVLERLMAQLQRVADWIAEHREDIERWVNDAVEALVKFSRAVDQAVEAVGGWKVVLGALLALKVASFASSLLLLAAALTRVATAGAMARGVGGFLASLGIRGAGVGGALALYHGGLNANEDEELARLRAAGDGMPVRNDSEPIETWRARMAASTGSSDAAMDSLMAKGWTRAQAAGIVANLKQESNFNPGAIGDGGKAYGIAQWHPDRQAEFKRWSGKDIRGSSFEEQLAFLDWEMREGREKRAGDRLKQATSAAEAGAVVSKYYERPADTAREMSNRARMAQQYDAAEQARAAQYAAANADTARTAGAGRGFVNQTNTSTSDVQIGSITVNTQATDAQGIAQEIGPAIKKTGLVTQANTGLM